MSLLALRQADAAYGPFRALFGVDLDVNEGQAVALLGSNGAGKSTVARVLSGLVPLTGGTLEIDGRDATRWSAARIRRAGIVHVPEGRGVFSTLSVEENLTLNLMRHSRRRRRALVQEAYDRFAILGERRNQSAGTLSGGQQRLVSLAAALVSPPRLLVTDELSLGLAPNVLEEIYDSLASLRQEGTALLVIEQQTRRALGLCERAIVVAHGRVAFDGEPAAALAAMEEELGGGVPHR